MAAMTARQQNLKSLRNWRVRPERDLTIMSQVKGLVREASSRHRQAGAAVAAWEAAAPAALRKACKVTGTSNVLTIRAQSASDRFQLDRWLRGGGEAALRSGGGARVKLT
jgi:hypothetical protein